MITEYETYSASSLHESFRDGPGYQLLPRESSTGVSEPPIGPGDRPPSAALQPAFTRLASDRVTRSVPEVVGEAPHDEPGGRQLAYVRSELDRLSGELRSLQDQRDRLTAQAAANEFAVFVLSKIVAGRRLRLEEMAAKLPVPSGWLAFAELWRAGLLDCVGGEVFPTDAGVELMSVFSNQDGG